MKNDYVIGFINNIKKLKTFLSFKSYSILFFSNVIDDVMTREEYLRYNYWVDEFGSKSNGNTIFDTKKELNKYYDDLEDFLNLIIENSQYCCTSEEIRDIIEAVDYFKVLIDLARYKNRTIKFTRHDS